MGTRSILKQEKPSPPPTYEEIIADITKKIEQARANRITRLEQKRNRPLPDSKAPAPPPPDKDAVVAGAIAIISRNDFSPVERSILYHFARNCSTKEVAAEVDLTETGIQAVLTALFKKTGIDKLPTARRDTLVTCWRQAQKRISAPRKDEPDKGRPRL